MGLKSILSSGYVWEVSVSPDNFVTAWVESDHAQSVAYHPRVHFGSHRVISSTCTCTTVDSKLCKHRAALLYAVVILANNIVERPSRIARWPCYKNWRPMVLAHIKCQGYDDMLNHFRSPLPPNCEKLAAKKKKRLPASEFLKRWRFSASPRSV